MAKLLPTLLRFFRSMKKAKAPRPAPVGLIKNWDSDMPGGPDRSLRTQGSTGTLSSTVSSMVEKTDVANPDFVVAELGGISDSDECAARPLFPVETKVKLTVSTMIMCVTVC
jgi:hypothetical protein